MQTSPPPLQPCTHIFHAKLEDDLYFTKSDHMSAPVWLSFETAEFKELQFPAHWFRESDLSVPLVTWSCRQVDQKAVMRGAESRWSASAFAGSARTGSVFSGHQ